MTAGPQDRRYHRANARSGSAHAFAALKKRAKSSDLNDYVVMIEEALAKAADAPDVQVCKNYGRGRPLV